jgi:hypothetical protein
MKKKIVRLSESDLMRIVKRVIKEDMGGMDDVHPRFGNLNLSDYNSDELLGMDDEQELSKGDVIELISDFFNQEILPELSPREQNILQRKVDSSDAGNIAERYLRENEESPRSMGGRNAGFGEKAMMGGGAGLALTGAISALGEFTGWSEFELTTKIHDFVEMAGMGNYSGPISLAMVAAGLALAFKGRAMKYNRTGR